MRMLTDHMVSGDPVRQLTINVLDEPGAGGANHEYLVRGTSTGRIPNSSNVEVDEHGVATFDLCRVAFQNGPIQEAGVNGVTHEALLAIVIDRLLSFQNGPYPSSFNHDALRHCRLALASLKARTSERIARGVEGTRRP